MLRSKMARLSAVAIVGIIMCGVTTEAKAQIAPALTAPLICNLNLAGAPLTIQAAADGLPFPHDVPCTLARIIHEHFCFNRGFAATTSLRRAGSPFAPSTYC